MNKYYFSLILFLITACQSEKDENTHMNEAKNDKLIVYQIFTRLFGNQNQTNKFNGTLEENGSGKFNDITDKALTELKNFGVSHVWFTGVIEHATMTDFTEFGISSDNPEVIKGIAGSPYAIKDYYDVNPALALDVKNRMKEFEALVERSHKLGLKVIIDFVPNHVARGYNSDAKPKGVEDFGETDNKNGEFSASNNFYYLKNKEFQAPKGIETAVKPKSKFVENPAKVTGNDVFTDNPTINDWYETVKLNYGINYLDNKSKHFEPIPNTWYKMRDILLFWQNKGVDGFRCDMAEMVPVEFWGWVIPQLKAQGESVFIAEIYNPAEYGNYLFKGKFDYLYDKVGLYDALRRMMEGGGNANDISRVWQNESGEFSNRMLRFLENHDEQRIASSFFAGDMNVGKTAMALSATLHGGPLMYYFGQEFGVKPTQAEGFQGDDGRTTIFDYWGVPEYQAWVNCGKFDGGKLSNEQKELYKFYRNLNEFVKSNESITQGKFWDLQYVNHTNYDSTKVYSFIRYSNNQRLLFVYNFDLKNDKQFNLTIARDLIKELRIKSEELSFKEVFTGSSNQVVTVEGIIETGDGIPINLSKNAFKIFSF